MVSDSLPYGYEGWIVVQDSLIFNGDSGTSEVEKYDPSSIKYEIAIQLVRQLEMRGGFNLIIGQNYDEPSNWDFRAMFSVAGEKLSDLVLFKKYFKSGTLLAKSDKGNNSKRFFYVMDNLEELSNFVLPFFDFWKLEFQFQETMKEYEIFVSINKCLENGVYSLTDLKKILRLRNRLEKYNVHSDEEILSTFIPRRRG